MHVEPFRPITEPNDGLPHPPLALYSTGQVILASLFGGPPAGALLLWSNHRRRGVGSQGVLIFALSLPLTATLIGAGFVLPDKVGNAALPIVTLAVMGALAQRDEALYRRNLAAGAPKASSWAAAGVGVASLVVLFGLGMGGYALVETRHSVDFGHDQTVVYEDGATEADAKKLGDHLKANGYFDDTGGATVHVARRGAGYVLNFAVKDGAWDKDAQIETFSLIGRQVGADVFAGTPITVRMCDEEMNPKRTFALPARARVEFGGEQTIVYEDSVTRAEAQALGAYLGDVGFFGEGKRPKDVGLRRQDGRLVVSFVVGEGKWNDDGLVQGFDQIRAGASRALENKPVTAELTDSRWVLRKTLP